MPPGSADAEHLGVVRVEGAPDGIDVTLVHGFTQSKASFASVAARLARAGSAGAVAAVDLPGHGDSPVPRPGEGLAAAARLLRATVGPSVLVGYSMGARVCLRLALDHPEAVRGLVLVGATPGIEDAAERAARREADESLASRIEEMALGEFLEEWLAGPLFASLSPEQADLRARLANTPAGLAAALRSLGTGAEAPMWDRLGSLARPGLRVLVVAGASDPKFTEIGRRITAAVGPGAQLCLIEGAGHAVPFEQPEAFVETLDRFLARPRR